VLAAMAFMPGPTFAALPVMPEPLETAVLSDKPADAHWVWIQDFQIGGYGRSVLFNADSGEILGMIDAGWESNKLDLPHSGDEIYNLGMYMSRGYRGERTDVVTTYDRQTLKPLREVITPSKAIKGLPDPNNTAISDDDRFLFMQFFTPASSVGIVDLKANKYVGEVETAGCAHVMAAGARRFFTLCGNGSALSITIDDVGKEILRKRSAPFFDPDKDPIHGSGTRSRDVWYFPSHRGEIHEVDVSGAELAFPPAWSITEISKGLHWVPGPLMQPIAIHNAMRRLYVLMHASDLKPKGGGYDFHRMDATEVWVFDLNTRRRLRRVVLKLPTSTMSVSQDASPLIYGGSIYGGGSVAVYDEASGKVLRDIPMSTSPILIQPLQ
jgi:methylamine dehydrogenase heavy chain